MLCHLCRSAETIAFDAFAALPRVTSDCRPWPAGGRISLCPRCACVQKPVDDAARRELDAIYADYAMYLQAGGNEQRALDASSGALDPRSQQILKRFLGATALPATGRWLDVGCGNGATLRAVSNLLPGWRSVGTELDDRNRAVVESIADVESLHAGPLETLDDAFDVISMVHVLEHVDEPVAFLKSLERLMRPGCIVFVELPYSLGNCFDLAIADHVTHFEERTLRECFALAGLEEVASGRNFLDREVFIVGRKGAVVPAASSRRAAEERRAALEAQLAWLNAVAAAVRELPPGNAGIFGSSIAATFAYGARGGDVNFFVDEDPDRIGRSHLAIPIRGVTGLAASDAVYVALPHQLAEKIVAKPGRAAWRMPPPYDAFLPQEAST